MKKEDKETIKGIYFNEHKHEYTDADGNVVPNVTKIIGQLDKPGIGMWMVNQALQAIEDGESMETAKMKWVSVRDEAGRIGTAVHKAIERMSKGEKPTSNHIELKGYLDAFNEFWENHIQSFNKSEFITGVINKDIQWTGTCDSKTINNDDETCVVDYKTSKSIYDTHIIQVCTYGFAEGVDKACIVRLGSEGKYQLKCFNKKQMKEIYEGIFLPLLKIYNTKNLLKLN